MQKATLSVKWHLRLHLTYSSASNKSWLRRTLFQWREGHPRASNLRQKNLTAIKRTTCPKEPPQEYTGKTNNQTTRIFLPFRRDCQGLEGLDKEMDHQPTDLFNWFWCLNCCFLGAREHCTMNHINKLSQHVCSPNKTSFTMQHKQVLNILPRCSWIMLCIAKSFLQQKLFIAWWV